VEWKGAKSLSRGRGVEKGRDLLTRTNGIKGRKMKAKWKKGRRGTELKWEGK
jgi:hypothetical protein